MPTRPYFARLADARRLLQADLVLTDAQLRRQGCWVPTLPSRTVMVATNVKNPNSWREVTFRALTQRQLDRTGPATLAHIVGTAAIRHELQLPEEGWTNESHRGAAALKPDGIYLRPSVAQPGQKRHKVWPVLVEYDAGGYSARVVRRKMRAFLEKGEVVWGVTSRLRARRLQLRYPQAEVLLVDWWSLELD